MSDARNGRVKRAGSVAELMDALNNDDASAGTPPSSDVTSTPASSATDGSGQTATSGASPSEQRPVSDVDLQRFCAKLADKFGGPQKVFNACKPFIANGDVARPTNIKRNEDRWAFIRRMEAQSGMKYHG
jgi:hypothetical protein